MARIRANQDGSVDNKRDAAFDKEERTQPLQGTHALGGDDECCVIAPSYWPVVPRSAFRHERSLFDCSRARPARTISPHPTPKKMQESLRQNRKTLLHELVTPGRIETAAVAYCWGELVLPIFVPITSPEIMISTRRFCCRPAGVSLLATGFDFPNPDRKSTRLNSSHGGISRMPSSA